MCKDKILETSVIFNLFFQSGFENAQVSKRSASYNAQSLQSFWSSRFLMSLLSQIMPMPQGLMRLFNYGFGSLFF
jgi:hypothetical protein